MMDFHIFEYLSAKSRSLEIWNNAHRDTRTTIERHLLHRERIGDAVVYAGHDGRAACIEADSLWELSLCRQDGSLLHIAGPALPVCLQVAQSMLEPTAAQAMAA